MAGTQPDGAARARADGQLEVNAELAYLFDYYLAGLGERPLDAIRTEIIRELERRLPQRRPRKRAGCWTAGWPTSARWSTWSTACRRKPIRRCGRASG
jgi:lipase chaperone LimK